MSDSDGSGAVDGPPKPSVTTSVAGLPVAAFVVALIGFVLLIAVTAWPPLVAVESETMEPNVHAGDLVLVVGEERFAGDAAHAETGVVTASTGAETGYTSFNGSGDVVVFAYNGDDATSVIHRAMFWVEAGEDWYERADPQYVGPAENCAELANCPAPHAGFVTKGDNPQTSTRYDQTRDGFTPVKPEWIQGKAAARVPWLGCLRLEATQSADRPSAC